MAFYGDLVGVKIGVECCYYFGIELLRDTLLYTPIIGVQSIFPFSLTF